MLLTYDFSIVVGAIFPRFAVAVKVTVMAGPLVHMRMSIIPPVSPILTVPSFITFVACRKKFCPLINSLEIRWNGAPELVLPEMKYNV